MAKFYVQLENKLLQISGELTAENISKALGYVPVSPNVTNELSQRVDNITFDSLKDNPFLQDGSGELNIVDEAGNIIAKIDADGIHSVDFIACNHKLTDKIDSSALNGYAKESWVTAEITKAATSGKVDLTGYATETYVDEKVAEIEIPSLDGYAKTEDIPSLDGYAKTSDIPSLDGYATETFVCEKIAEIEIPSLDGYAKTSDIPSLDSYAKTEDIPSLDGYAKTEDIPSLDGYLKAEDLGDISLDGYATEQFVNDKIAEIDIPETSHLATKSEVADIDFYDINNNPVLNTEDGKLLFVDEAGNIGLRLEQDNTLYVKDVIAGDHMLSSKANTLELEELRSLVNDLLARIEALESK